MKKIFTVLSFLLPILLTAQTNKDSFFVYQDILEKKLIDGLKAIEESNDYKILKEKRIAYNLKHNNYSSWGLFLNYNNAKLNDLNTSINNSGFSSFNNFQIGLGLTSNIKIHQTIWDITWFNISFSNNPSNNVTNQKIQLNTVDFLQTQLGYAIVDKRKITIYPYIGLGLRSSTLRLNNIQTINPTGTNISNYVITPKFVQARSLKFTYQAGLAADFKIKENEKKGRASFLTFKAGINNTIGDENFRIDEAYKFNPNAQIANWQLQIGLKFVNY